MRTISSIFTILLCIFSLALTGCAEKDRDVSTRKSKINCSYALPSHIIGSEVKPIARNLNHSSCTEKTYFYACPLKCGHSRAAKPGKCSGCGSNLSFISLEKPSPSHDFQLISSSH